MEHKGMKTLTQLLSKTAGLIFFSFLAISLGVVFGLLFEGWVKDQPGAPVGSENTTLQTSELPGETGDGTVANTTDDKTAAPGTVPAKPNVTVKYRVKVGPYSSRNEALSASQQLQSLGYPVYVGNAAPYAVQVGAFATQSNAEKLKTELIGKGYKVVIDQN